MAAATSDDLVMAVKEILDHAPAYRMADRMYRGEVDEVFASPKIAALLQKSSSKFRTNLAATPVDAVLNGLSVNAAMVPGAAGQPDDGRTRDLKERIWDANELDLYLPDWLRDIGKLGDCYLFVWEGEEDGTCEVHIHSPIGARMIYDEEKPRVKKFYAYTWREGKKFRVNLVYPDRIEKYVSTVERPKSKEDFRTHEDEGDGGWPITHDYEEIPVFHGRTEHPYGVPDHKNAFGPQNAINKLVATHMASIDFQGFPQRAALQDATLEDDGDAWDEDDNEGTGASGTIDTDDESNLTSAPGRLWMLKNVRQLVQLEAANPDSFLKPLDKQVQLMSASTGTPLRFFTGTAGQQPSGASLSEDDKRLTARKRRRTLLAGATLSDALTFGMRKILGQKDCPPVTVQWAPIERAEYTDQWETVEVKQRAGVPRDVTLVEAGYTDTEVTQWRENMPDPGAGLAPRVELLERLGSAVEKLAAAAELGALDMSVVQSFVAGFLPAPEEDDEE